MSVTQPVSFSLTKYVELFQQQSLPGPVSDTLFETTIEVDGWKEIRLWVQVFIDNYATTPLTPHANLQIRFFHNCSAGSFSYETANFPFIGVTSLIDGYTIKPIIGKQLRLLCFPTNLPAGPYTLSATYLLVR